METIITPSDLLEAADQGNFKKLIECISAGVDVNSRDDDLWTPLHWAVWNGRKTCVEVLLSHHADVNAKSVSDETPLHTAAEKEEMTMLELLIKHGANPNNTDNDGDTPAHILVKHNNFWSFKTLQKLLEYDPDLSIKNNKGMTALDIAIDYEDNEFIECLTAYQEHRYLYGVILREQQDSNQDSDLHF